MARPFTCAKGLPAFLKEAGYHTIHCGKAHWGSSSYNKKSGKGSPPPPGADPRAFGFDVNIAGCEIGGPGGYRGDQHYGARNQAGAPQWWIPGLDENNYYERDVFLTDALTEESLRAVKTHVEANPHRPFFLHLAMRHGTTPALGTSRAPTIPTPRRTPATPTPRTACHGRTRSATTPCSSKAWTIP